MVMHTEFAPAERAGRVEIAGQNQQMLSMDFLVSIAEASNSMFMVLNRHRQVVFANHKLLTLMQSELDRLLGLRPGEVLHCINSSETEGGCGTTEACRECGAVNSILKALNGEANEQECRISARDIDRSFSFDLSVRAHPMEFNGNPYVFFSVIDISDSKRKEILERTFLHDVLNTAGGVYGFSGLLKEDLKDLDAETLEKAEIIYDLSDKLVQEIKNHQRLRAAEKNDLIVDAFEFDLKEFMPSVINIIKRNKDVTERKIILENCDKGKITTDRVLLQRILINMIKNAAEAIDAGEKVLVNAYRKNDGFVFSVNNPGVMPDAVKRQIFQRSFSTKGSNRGIGTYSMKLFGENYLKGKVWFESREEAGTTFFLELPQQLQMNQ